MYSCTKYYLYYPKYENDYVNVDKLIGLSEIET